MIGDNIKILRENAGLTQEQLGNLVGVSGVSIMRYEKGDREPRWDMINKIADALGVTPAKLVGWEDEVKDAAAELYLRAKALGFKGAKVICTDSDGGTAKLDIEFFDPDIESAFDTAMNELENNGEVSGSRYRNIDRLIASILKILLENQYMDPVGPLNKNDSSLVLGIAHMIDAYYSAETSEDLLDDGGCLNELKSLIHFNVDLK